MKKISFIQAVFCLVILSVFQVKGQGTWTQKANIPPDLRTGAIGFEINGKGYVGLGAYASFYTDLWEYDPSSDSWTQKTDYPGAERANASVFVVNGKAYVCNGLGAGITTGDNTLYEYDPTTDTWTQKADFPGAARYLATSFSVGGKGYIGLGYDTTTMGNFLQDFWEYDPATDTWTQKANFGGTARSGATGFSIGNKGYVGTGYDGNVKNDFWQYDPALDTWTAKSNFPSSARFIATGFSLNGIGYIGTGANISSNYFTDFKAYDPLTDMWSAVANFSGGLRRAAVSFVINGKAYLGSGNRISPTVTYQDFWEFTPANAGMPESESKEDVDVYPNPFSASALIQLHSPLTNGTMTIVDCFGQVLFQLDNISGTTIHLDKGNLAPGMYMVNVTEDGQLIGTKRVVVSE